MIANNKQFDGSTLAARYAFMPNKLRYCGGDSNSEIFEYITHQASDPGLQAMLKEFETMFPYLKLIAVSNKIADPFNYKVVEAYWIGNELLENVSMQNFYRYLIDEQKLKKKFKPDLVEKVFGKIPVGAKPHHSFHVFNIPKRTGHYPVEHTVETMDSCRIAWGKIKNPKSEIRNPKQIQNSNVQMTKTIIAEYQPLVVNGDKLELGKPIEKEVFCEVNDQAFVKEPKAGSPADTKALAGKWVSLHWGWVCDFLSQSQVENLNKWTKYNLALANLN